MKSDHIKLYLNVMAAILLEILLKRPVYGLA